MKSRKYQKVLFLALVSCAALMYSGCGSNPQQIDNSFDNLCKMSGGIVSADGQSCLCGHEAELICPNGSVCDYHDPEECAVKEFVQCEKIGKRICRNGRVRYCTEIHIEEEKTNRQIWVEDSTGCTAGCNISGDGCKNECSKDSRKCSDDRKMLFACETNGNGDDRYIYSASCDLKLKCNEGENNNAYCNECDKNELRCIEGKTQRCAGGRWTDLYDYCKECEDGATKCRPDENNPKIGVPLTCMNGKWEYTKKDSCSGNDDDCSCDGHVSCTIAPAADGTDEVSTCGDCQNDAVECFEHNGKGYLVSCKNGSYKSGEESVITCSDGSCPLDAGVQKCTNNASCAYKYDMCLYDTGCECGDHNCSFGEYCKDGTCVKSTELDNTVRNDWVCGDCQNNPELSVSLQLCGSDNVTSNCHNDALLNIPVSMTKTCMASASINNCIQSIFEVSCLLSTCQRFRSRTSCDDLALSCWKVPSPYHECGIARESAFYFKKYFEPCTDETCSCGTQTCENGQICWENNENKACFDKDSNNVKTCLEESCRCGDSSCTQNQYCVNDQKCVDKLVDIGVMVDCGDEQCSLCLDGPCTCGNKTCQNYQYCVGTGSNSDCKTISEMQLVPVNLCKNEACRCGEVATCKSGQYCVDEKRCVDSIPETNAIYEFVDSYGHVCKQFMGDCDANMVALDTCIENNQKDYKKCIDQCGQEKCAATCTQSDCQLDCANCKAACSNPQSAADDRCMLDAKGKSEEPVGILARFADDVTCTPSSAGTSSTSTCHYSCTSGRYIPFRASTSCDGQ